MVMTWIIMISAIIVISSQGKIVSQPPALLLFFITIHNYLSAIKRFNYGNFALGSFCIPFIYN